MQKLTILSLFIVFINLQNLFSQENSVVTDSAQIVSDSLRVSEITTGNASVVDDSSQTSAANDSTSKEKKSEVTAERVSDSSAKSQANDTTRHAATSPARKIPADSIAYYTSTLTPKPTVVDTSLQSNSANAATGNSATEPLPSSSAFSPLYTSSLNPSKSNISARAAKENRSGDKSEYNKSEYNYEYKDVNKGDVQKEEYKSANNDVDDNRGDNKDNNVDNKDNKGSYYDTHEKNFLEKGFAKFKETKFAQTLDECHWSVFGGVGSAIMHFDREDIFRHYVCNVRLGVTADHNLSMLNENLFVETGIEAQRKGYQRFFEQHADYLHTDHQEKTNLYYLIIPTTAFYRFEFRGFEFTPLFGPYFGIALGGRYKLFNEDIDHGESIVQKKTYPMFGDKSGTDRLYDTRRFDFGLRFAVGIQYFKRVKTSIGYDLGLVDVIKADFKGDKYKSKNGAFYISVAYLFPKKEQ